MDQILESLQLPALWDEIVNLVRFPYSNITAALLLMAAVVIFVLLLASIVIAIVSRPSRRRLAQDAEELAYLQDVVSAWNEVESGEEAWSPPAVPVEPRRGPRWWLAWFAWTVAAVLVIGVAVGVSSASSAVCVACHEVTPHSEVVAAGATDPHEATACVRCHEPAGWLGSVTIEVPGRLGHQFNGLRAEPQPTSYGSVVSSACNQCHRSVAREITEDEERGVRMAHEHPLEAGAQCLDCHRVESTIVSKVTVGMTPCLRCHDGENQPTTCTLCHTKDVSAATRSRTNVAAMTGRALITTPDCGGCHEETTQCDPCHGGVRMPHTELFRWWGHAREGAKDLWFTDGERCARCHTEQRRPCTRCHAFFPGHAAPSWAREHGRSVDPTSCDGCHGNTAYVAGRDFCELCHGEPLITE